MPAASRSRTSSYRFWWAEPARWCAPARRRRRPRGCRALTASTSISRSVTPRYSSSRSGTCSRSLDQRLRVGPSVRLDEPDDDVDALAAQLVRVLEHPVALADARRGADVQTEPRASLFLDAREYRLGGRRRRRLHSANGATSSSGYCPSSARLSSSTLTRGLAEEAQLPPGRVRLDEPTDVGLRDAALARNARHLELRRRRRDVRVEPGRRRGDEIDRHRRPGILLLRRLDRRLHRVDELLVGRPQVRARRSSPRRSRCRPPTAASGSSRATRTPGR